MQYSTDARHGHGDDADDRTCTLTVAMPEPGLSMTQDTEWCLVEIDGEWRQIRFHDYETLYSIPGLYEKVIYEILKCSSPVTIRRLLESELLLSKIEPQSLRVLDLGAGNGIVAEELRELGVSFCVGSDIVENAAVAAERDRPHVYDHYHVVDITHLSVDEERRFRGYRLNAMTCVAALGFGDIPPAAFAAAYNFVRPGGWIAFNIKDSFLDQRDRTGFSGLIHRMISDGTLKICQQKRYQHRLATDGRPLHYVAIVGVKNRDIAPDAVE